VALAALCLVGQLFSFAHLGLVRHVTCPEHGELVHADGDALDAAAGAARSQRSQLSEDALPSYGDVPSLPSGHGHDHCLVTTLRRDHLAHQPSHAAVVAQPEQSIASHAGGDEPSAAFALFRLAPKNSPPVA